MPETAVSGDLSPRQVAVWLSSPEGEKWLQESVRPVLRHSSLDGSLASVCDPPTGSRWSARWPEPFYRDRLR